MHSRNVTIASGLLLILVPGVQALANVGVETQANAEASVDELAANLTVSPGLDEALLVAGPTGSDSITASVQDSQDLEGSGTPTADVAAVAGTVAALALVAAFWNPLKGLALALLAPLFSRIDRSSVLDLEARQRVRDVVAHNPGVTIKEVATLCSLGWGTTVYHLDRLENERVLVSQRQRQYRRYFVYGGTVANEAKTAYGELLAPLARRLAELVQSAPGRCQKELCESLQIRPSLAHKHLGRLIGAGLLSAHREWKLVRYYPTAQLAGMLPMLTNPIANAALAPAVAA